MELRHLRYFVAVAEHLNFSRAARRLNVSQPPLTQAIRHLEDELKVSLFTRTTRRVELTDAGNLFLSRARSILAQVTRTVLELGSNNPAKREILRVGITRALSILPAALKAFRKRFPNVHLELLPSVSRYPHDFLSDDEADLNIGAYLPPDGTLDSRLWADLSLMAVFPTSHPYAKRKQIGIGDLRSYPLLLPGLTIPFHMGREALQFCRETGRFEPQVVQHCDDIEVLLALIASEAGVGILHGVSLNKIRPGLAYVSFRERSPLLKMGVVWRRDRVCPALLGLIEELEATIRPMTKNILRSVHYPRR
jgi:DNA-binding transcriptional LysR family regulator